jgi:hypothetical protein
MILDADDRVDFFVNGTNTVITMPQPLVRGAWTHLAGTYDGQTIRLYVDGEEVASRAYTGAIGNNTRRCHRPVSAGDGRRGPGLEPGTHGQELRAARSAT